MNISCIISDHSDKINKMIESLEFNKDNIITFENKSSDNEWHKWTSKMLIENNIQKIIIPLSLSLDGTDNIIGLKIAMHIRLNYEIDISKRLIPIIILTDKDLENITVDSLNLTSSSDSLCNLHHLLYTKGTELASFEKEEVIDVIKNIESCEDNGYKPNILNHLKLSKTEEEGKHSIANAWGCFKLASVIGLRNEILKNDEIGDKLNHLYSKYLIVSNESYEKNQFADIAKISCYGKKILLIDDQNDEGWEKVLKNIFNSAQEGFVAIDSSKYKNTETKNFADFNGFYNECISLKDQNWDLIFIDLRLHPEVEDIDTADIKPEDLSGYKLIEEYLRYNEGYQIIVITASNKIWNINPALKRGAEAYYIKESPEFNYSMTDTKLHYEKLKNEIERCFCRRYLKDFWGKIEEIKNNFLPEVQDIVGANQFKSRIIERLEMFFGLLKRGKEQSSYNEQRFYFSDIELAYITLWSVLNEISEVYYKKTQSPIWPIKDFNGTILKDNSSNPIEKHPNGDELKYLNTPYRKHFKWVIKNQNDVFIEYTYKVKIDNNGKYSINQNDFYDLDYERKTALKLDKNGEFHINNTLQRDERNNEQQLFMQIAFLIKKKKQLAGNEKEPNYLCNLKKLNELRNKLYLTHGEDTGSNFYKKTEREKRDEGDTKIRIEKEIKDLFGLVGFLLTGKNITLNL